MKSYLFNPQNDLALASGNRFFTPPRNAALLAHAGSLLPLWYAGQDDSVIAEVSNPEWINQTSSLFNLTASVSTSCNPRSSGAPWGWSAAAVTTFLKHGINRDCLPDDHAIERMRQLSHRQTSLEINRQLARLDISVPPPAIQAFSHDEISAAINHFNNRFVIKSPWSSTGRGVFLSTSTNPNQLLKNADGILRHQGSVIVEPLLDRKVDFAMLFHAKNGIVSYRGLSLFETVGTAYTGNLILPEATMVQQIEQSLDNINLSHISNSLQSVLTNIIGTDYEGWLGVDMMIYDDGKLAPCIELNLRMTMGVVALTLRDRFVAPGSTGYFTVQHGQFPPADLSRATIVGGRLVDGTVDLVPPGQGFRIAMKIAGN